MFKCYLTCTALSGHNFGLYGGLCLSDRADRGKIREGNTFDEAQDVQPNESSDANEDNPQVRRYKLKVEH